MAGPEKTTDRTVNLRVKKGSALERMIEGRKPTDAIHQMAELFERALQEDWGPPESTPLMDDAPAYQALVESGVKIVASPHWKPQDTGQLYPILEADGTTRMVGEAELLVIMGDQMPAGLVPVRVVQDDEDDEPVLIGSVDEEDLSHLI